MYVAPCDMKILCSEEVTNLKKEYRKRFGEQFICFNYADFQGTEKKCAAQIYLEALRQAVKASGPYRIVSQRYEEFDH